MVRYARIQIPPNARGPDIIFLLNKMKLEIDVESDDPELQMFIRDHKDWFRRQGQ